MNNMVIKVVAGALIPSFATIVFNLMNFFFENYKKTPLPEISPSAYDIAAGCIFSIIGICVTATNHQTTLKLLVVGVVLILLLLSFDMLLPALLNIDKHWMVYFVDFLAFGALSWSIREAG